MVSERTYHKAVGGWLYDSFADVDHEETLESGRRVDFVAHTPFHSYVIEVENSWENRDVTSGMGQTVLYGAETGHERVVVFPADDVDEEDLAMLEEYEHAPEIEMV